MKIQWQGSAFFLEASLGVYDRLGAHKQTPQGGGTARTHVCFARPYASRMVL